MKKPFTVITREYPETANSVNEPYYPINDRKNEVIAGLYRKQSRQTFNTIFGGRLAEYKYYNMDEVIIRAIDCCNLLR